MINLKEISIEWINQVSKANKNADKILVEKVNPTEKPYTFAIHTGLHTDQKLQKSMSCQR